MRGKTSTEMERERVKGTPDLGLDPSSWLVVGVE